jgi:hypothetical protein
LWQDGATQGNQGLSMHTFTSKATQVGGKVAIVLPFDPNQLWGEKARHHIHGTVDGHTIRAELGSDGERYFLLLGSAWRRDNSLDADREFTVALMPEGPQTAAMSAESGSADIGDALQRESAVSAFFDALPTFYRKNFIRWIESAKRPETRAARIAEMVELLKKGKRER